MYNDGRSQWHEWIGHYLRQYRHKYLHCYLAALTTVLLVAIRLIHGNTAQY